MTATYALIPAAGRAARFKSDANGGNKVFAPLCGQPILRRTVEAFSNHDAIDGIVVVTGAQDVGRCQDVLSGMDKVLAILPGGETRQESVAVGLYALGGDADDLILVHDGARPLVTQEVIARCIAQARSHGNAVAALPVADTLKVADAAQTVTRTVDREGLWAVQTPQAFFYRALADAHIAARDAGWTGTDEASLIEQFGMPLFI